MPIDLNADIPEGLSRRDFLAGLALNALISNPSFGPEAQTMADTARLAVAWAEVLLDALE
ncbi:MAG: hypothetical protein HC769_25510 [Cyanobacteria bacterium CRU_2_1]|nr:hypothetical protein [Cyanobacteria bacterium RU_5_0]NJR61890.1 hypothetical protein [Cyanobacteria bacterium CRU_2_1]